MASIFRRLRLGFGNRADSYGPEKSWLPGIDFRNGSDTGTIDFNGTDWDVSVNGVQTGTIPGGGGGGGIASVQAGDGIEVDATDPDNPEVSAKVSADADNALSIGSDGGLYATAGGAGPTGEPLIMIYRGNGLPAIPSADGVFFNDSSVNRSASGCIGRSTGKRFFAAKVNTLGNLASLSVGIRQSGSGDILTGQTGTMGTNRTASWGLAISGGSWIRYHGSAVSAGLSAPANGVVIVVYVDFSTGSIWWQANNVVSGGGDPAAGTSPSYSNVTALCFPGFSGAFDSGTSTPMEMEINLTDTSPFGATIAAGYTPWNV